MNINYFNNQNRTSFGAFQTPPKSVMSHFSDVIVSIKPEHRQAFVDEIGKIVEDAKDCPVPISHEIVEGYTTYYSPVVRGKHITTANHHSSSATYIIDVMKQASAYAKNLADADSNVQKLKQILNFPG